MKIPRYKIMFALKSFKYTHKIINNNEFIFSGKVLHKNFLLELFDSSFELF